MFKIEKWDILEQENTVRFYFVCDEYGSFSEDIIFPKVATLQVDDQSPVLKNLLDVTAAYLGVSYYKLAAASHVQFRIPIADSAKQSINKIYTEGLGEFYVRNGLDYPANISCGYLNQPPLSAEVDLDPDAAPTAVLAFGGGKDSHVSMHILEDMEIEYEPVSVILSDKVGETLKQLAGKDLTFIRRKIDPRLIELNKKGEGYNGHIPITAINSVLLSIYAYLSGHQWVVFSNERGASVPTMMHEGTAVNHQYSKSFDFENLFIDMLKDVSGGAVTYFSLLRPFSELWIARYLALHTTQARAHFSSCNRNFVFEGDHKLEDGKRWCGKCSKCVYTAIILAPHLTKTEFVDIFGSHILNEVNNLQVAKNLCGIGEDKPWECVGDVIDTAASLFHLITLEEWRGDALPSMLNDEIEKKYGAGHLTNRFKEQLTSDEKHHLPEDLSILLNMVI